MAYAKALLGELRESKEWPLPRLKHIDTVLARRAAWLTADKETLAQIAGVNLGEDDYVVDPLASTISTSFADFLFSRDPKITTDAERDQQQLLNIVQQNSLPESLHLAAITASSEGEVWYTISSQPGLTDAPQINWWSRRDIVPLFSGKVVAAAAVITDIKVESSTSEEDLDTVWRIAEIHEKDNVHNVLFRGDSKSLGAVVPLDSIMETVGVPEIWPHGLGLLIGRVVNRMDNWQLGGSDYDRIEGLLLALNETVTIGQSNVRLTARKRLIVGEELVENGKLNVDTSVYQMSSRSKTLGESATSLPLESIEYSYDADQLIAHKTNMEMSILSRVGLVAQLIGQGESGTAESGTARRLRFLPTENATSGKARAWDFHTPRLLQLAMRVDALPTSNYGYGRTYSDLQSLPTVERSSILPVDETETVKNVSTAYTAGVATLRTAVTELHPDWSTDQVDTEVEGIVSANAAAYQSYQSS